MYSHDSLNEGKVAALLEEAGLSFRTQEPTPVSTWPWKTPRSRGAPKCDFFLPDHDVYIEVKGWMTLYGLAKSAWLCRQRFAYYLFQNDDETWEPFLDSPCRLQRVERKSKAALLRSSNEQQIEELKWFTTDPNRLTNMNQLTRARIKRHIEGRIDIFKEWTSEFP